MESKNAGSNQQKCPSHGDKKWRYSDAAVTKYLELGNLLTEINFSQFCRLASSRSKHLVAVYSQDGGRRRLELIASSTICFYLDVLVIEPRNLQILGQCSITEVHPHLCLLIQDLANVLRLLCLSAPSR